MPDEFLSSEEQDIANRLAAYHRKIVSLRAPAIASDAAEGLETPRADKNRRRVSQQRSAAEDYRHARSVQRLLQGVCTAQIVLTLTLAVIARQAVLLAFLPGDAFGMAASLARVQRSHGVCAVFNIAYLLSSVGMPLVLVVAVVKSGGGAELADHIQHAHDTPISVVAVGITAGIASVLGGIMSSYVLARPLHLYRYESVALDEATADLRSERQLRRGGKDEKRGPLEMPAFGGGALDEEMAHGGGSRGAHATDALEPIDAWLVAGEVGVAAAPRPQPLIFMPVQIKPKPPPDAVMATPPLPTLPPPPMRSASSAANLNAATPSAAGAPSVAAATPPSAAAATEGADETPPAWSSAQATMSALAPAMEEAAAGGASGVDSGGGGEEAAGEEATPERVSARAFGISVDGVAVGGEAAAAEEGGEDEDEWGAGAAAVDDGDEEAGGEEDGGKEGVGGDEGGNGDEGGGEQGDAAGGDEGGGGTPVSSGEGLRARLRGLKDGLKDYAADAATKVADKVYDSVYAQQSADELFARAKALNKEGKYLKACELIEEAFSIQPKISTALSAANLRLKLHEYDKAIGAYRMVLAKVGAEEWAPTEREYEMATRKLAEAEQKKRESAINVSALVRTGEPKPATWYAAQLDELSDDLFAESATLYAEYGTELQDGLKEISRHLRATRYLACGQVLRPVEKLMTKACLSPRDEGEREWLTTVRTLLNELRALTSEVHDALKEFSEQGPLGWRAAGESMGITTEWRPGDDGSLWVRMRGELTSASLMHAAGVAHEAELWPKWVPFCSHAETLKAIAPTELVTYVQFDLTSMMKRGAILHWSLSDSLVERRSILLLGASLSDETSPFGKPSSAHDVRLADFRAIKVLITPRTRSSCRIEWITNVDLRAPNMPQTLVSMVTKKLAGAIVSLLVREAQKVTAIEAEADASGAMPAVDNPYLQRVAEGGAFYKHVQGKLDQYFELFGEDEQSPRGEQ